MPPPFKATGFAERGVELNRFAISCAGSTFGLAGVAVVVATGCAAVDGFPAGIAVVCGKFCAITLFENAGCATGAGAAAGLDWPWPRILVLGACAGAGCGAVGWNTGCCGCACGCAIVVGVANAPPLVVGTPKPVNPVLPYPVAIL